MRLWDRLLCYFGIHMRSRRKAKKSPAGWHSVCRNCGHPMMKLKGGEWRIMDRTEPAPKENQGELRKAEARFRRTPPPPKRRRKGQAVPGPAPGESE